MATVKAGVPANLWVNVIYELQSYLDPTDPRYDQIDRLLRGTNPLVNLDTASFCSAVQPPAVQPTIGDFTSGNWISVLTDYALASVYARICE